MKKNILLFLLVLSLCVALSSCAWMELGRIAEIDDAPPNRPPSEPELVASFEGYGYSQTVMFTCEKNWVLHWLAVDDTYPLIYIRTSDNEPFDDYGRSFYGTANIYDIGTYYLRLRINGQWFISIYYQ